MYKVYQLVYNKIQESLKSYIKGGQIEEKTSLQSIQITLTNIHIRKSALKSLMIPFVIQNSSKVKKIQLSISHAPKLKLVVEGLHLVFNPTTLKYLNAEYLKNLKFEKLAKWEKNQRDSMNTAGTFGKKLMDWLIPSLLTRVKVELKNFTITYQDTENLQILGFPSLLVVKLGSAKVWRDHQEWEKKSEAEQICVNVSIQDLSVILRCDPIQYEKGTNVNNIYDEVKISERNYLLRPCVFEGDLKISKESAGNTLNSLTIRVLQEINLAVNEYQLLFIEGFLNFIDASEKSNKYSFLKPKNSAKNAPGEWWKFLIGAFKHDARFNISKVITMQKVKDRYTELYKRVQRVIQAPVLLKLTLAEEQEMKEIEEDLLYEEIIKFRTQALEQIKKKVTQDKKAYSNKHHDENMKKYFKDYYSDMVQDLSVDFDSADETSEELENPEKKTKFFLSFNIHRVIISLNLLKNPFTHAISLLDSNGCKCARCVPLPKDSDFKSHRATTFKPKQFEVPEREFVFPVKKSTQFDSKSPQECSLLPNRKMKDVIIEHGDDFFIVGSICYKSRTGESYEPNILKEYTLLLIVIDNTEIKANGTMDLVKLNMQISNLVAFDPLICSCPTLESSFTEKVEKFEDLKNFNSWFSFIFKYERDNKAHWSLRHFMRDHNALPEFEFWLHYYELITGKDICLCGSSYKSEQIFKDALLLNEQNPLNNIHLQEGKRMQSANHFGFTFIKDTALKIEKNLMKVFPYFLQVSLRYFYSEVFRECTEQNPLKIMVEVAKGSSLEQYSSFLEVDVFSLPVILSTSCLSYLKLYLNPEKSSMQQKSIYKQTFTDTLEHLSKRELLIKKIFYNTEQSQRVMKKIAKLKLKKIPKFTLDLCVKSLELTLFTLEVKENLKISENLVVALNEFKIEKDVVGSFRDSDFGLNINLDAKLDPDSYLMLKASLKSLVVKIETDIVKLEKLQIVFNMNPFLYHPTYPNVLVDFHVCSILVNVDRNFVLLMHFFKSLDLELSKFEQANFVQTILKDTRRSESDFFNELQQQAIENYQDRNCIGGKSKIEARKRVLKEEFVKLEKENFIEKAFKKHEMPSENCKHCVIKYLKIISCIHVTIGSTNENLPNALTIKLKDDESIFFEASIKHLLVKVEERPLVSKISVVCSKIVGKNETGDSLVIKPGYGKQKLQTLIPANLVGFFPLTNKFYYQQADSFGYPLVCINRCLYQVKEGNDEMFELKKSPTGGNKGKVPEFEISENEIKVEVFVDSVFATIDLLGECKLLKGVLTIGKWISLGTSLTENSKSKIFTIKNLNSSACIKINSIKISLELGELDSSLIAYNLEFSILPVSITPQFSQILFKGKDAEGSFIFQKTLKIMTITFEINKILTAFFLQFDLVLSDLRESKVKILNKTFTCVSSALNEKLEIKIMNCKIFSGESLILAIPGEFSRNFLTVNKGKQIEIRTDKSEIFYISIPQVGLNLEVGILKSILQNLALLPSLNLKVQNFEDFYIKDQSMLHQKKSNPRLSIIISELYLHLHCENYQILILKLFSISIFNNLSKEIFEKNNFNSLRELIEDRSSLYTKRSEIVLLFKSLELVPCNSIHDKMVEFDKEYSVSLKIDTQLKKVWVFCRNTLKAVIINKVFEELILTIKDLKSVKKKKPKQDEDDQFTVDIDVGNGIVYVPRSSGNKEHVELRCRSAKVHVFMGSGMVFKPVPATEETLVVNGKEAMVEEYFEPVNAFCDFVEIKLCNVNVKTDICGKKKDLGFAESINVNVCSPSASEALEVYSWKTDSFVDVRFMEVELKASLSYFLNLQKLFEDNFDEEVTLYPKVKKVQKVNLNFEIGQSELEIQAIEIVPNEIKLEDINLELKPSTSVEISPIKFSDRVSRTKSEFMFGRLTG